MTQQHYRMTLEDAIAHYKSGDLTAKGALKFWIRIRLKTGWESFIDTKELRELFDMPRSTFWEAMGKLEDEGEIELSDSHKIHIKRLSNSSEKPDSERKTGQQAEKPDGRPENRMNVRNSEQVSEILDNQDLEPASEGCSSDSSNSYQIFINSLSEDERAKFLSFVREKIKNLSQEVNDIEAWLAHTNKAGKNRWEVYYSKYLDSKQTQPKKSSAKNALDEYRQELELQQQQAQKAWEQLKNQNTEG